MIRKYFPFCFYVLVSVLCLGKPSLAYPSGSFGGELVIPAVTATSETDSITPLKIGDKIPDELWDYAFPVVSPHTDQVQYLTLGDFRDKLIILDFWATWCSSCISAMPKLKELGTQIPELYVLPVTKEDDADRIKRIINTNETLKGLSLTSVFGDAYLSSLFPHRMVPHYVWIGPDGVVKAVTSSYEINRENINAVLQGKGTHQVVDKIDIDPTLPFISTNKLPFSKLSGSFILYHGRIDGTGAGVRKRKFEGGVGMTWSNLPLFSMYKRLGAELIPNFSYKHLSVKVSDPAQLIREESTLEKNVWHRQNDHTMEIMLPSYKAHNLYDEILHQLNQYADYEVSIVEVKKECLVLRAINDKSLGSSSETYYNTFGKERFGTMTNVPLSYLITWFNKRHDFEWLVTTELDLQTKINLKLDSSITDLTEIQNALRPQGLVLEKTEMPIKKMVIRDKTITNAY